MQNTIIEEIGNDRSPVQRVTQEQYDCSNCRGFFRWWYTLTAIPELGEEIDPIRCEAIRKSRLLSMIVFFLLMTFVMFAPVCLFLPNHYVIVADLSMLVISVLALILNRADKTLLAGRLLVLTFEAALVMVVFTTMPLDSLNIQLYELFIFGELLAVSLLNARSVFFIALFNSLFIIASLLYQPQIRTLSLDLQIQFWPILVLLVSIQLLVAGVTYFWVSTPLPEISHMASAGD
jgi:hypothetical protein